MKAHSDLAAFNQGLRHNIRTAARDTASGFIEVFHNGFAMLGFVAAIVCLVAFSRPDLRRAGEAELLTWLQVRQNVFAGSGSADLVTADPDAIELTVSDLDANDRATAADPADLPKQQAAVAYWLSKKYRIAPEPLSALVAEAYAIGAKAKLEPTLILAIMAIESGFNPFAQSNVGAQGLMQVMTNLHSDKYENFGGKFAAFDPLANLRVGVKVLQGCIAQAGSVEGGLKYYVGAANLANDGGYTNKVVAEYARLYQVAYGKPPPKRKAVTNTPEPTIVRSPTPSLDKQTNVVPVSAPASPSLEAPIEKIAAL
jgi:soluble lytic murein transglycosylase-like protein